jgi:hypothetical protein
MTLAVTAFALSTLAMTLVVIGQLWNRKAHARIADTSYALAALARLQGKPDLADERTARAEVHARAAWPFTPKPPEVYETPVGLITFDGTMTEDEVAEFTARWRDQVARNPRCVAIPLPHRPRRRRRR